MNKWKNCLNITFLRNMVTEEEEAEAKLKNYAEWKQNEMSKRLI